MDSNNLGSIIKNDAARRVIYSAWFIAGILIGAVQVAYADPDPQWLTTTFDVWSYLGIPIAALATANGTSRPAVLYAPEATSVNADNVIVEEDNSHGI